jgi:hypothetical protein
VRDHDSKTATRPRARHSDTHTTKEERLRCAAESTILDSQRVAFNALSKHCRAIKKTVGEHLPTLLANTLGDTGHCKRRRGVAHPRQEPRAASGQPFADQAAHFATLPQQRMLVVVAGSLPLSAKDQHRNEAEESVRPP